MNADSDELKPVDEHISEDFANMTAGFLSNIQYKLLGLIFIIFIILSSDIFINRVLSQFSGATESSFGTLRTKSWGTILQGLILISSAAGVDSLIRNNFI